MRNLIATYESHLAVKVIMFLCFSKYAAGFGFAYHSALALKAYELGGALMALPSLGMIAFNLFILVHTLLKYLQTRAFCAA